MTSSRSRTRRIAAVIGIVIAAGLLLTVLAPTQILERVADGRTSSAVSCGRLVGLKLHLHSWPLIGRVLAGAPVGADGHVAEVVTSSYSVHDVTFAARSVHVNRTALLGSGVDASVTGLTTTALLTSADLTRLVRSFSPLPVEVTSSANGQLKARIGLSVLSVAVPVTLALRGNQVEISLTLPGLGPTHLQVQPPQGIQLRSLSTTAAGLRITAMLPSVNSRTVLCGSVAGRRS